MIEPRFMCRGKRMINRKWIYGYHAPVALQKDGMDTGEYTHHIFVSDGHVEYVIDPQTLGQCTGVRDVNDADIFEGDLVLDRSALSGSRTPMEVAYQNGEWVCRSNVHDSPRYYPLPDFSSAFDEKMKLEVIGNIYDGLRDD